MPLVEGKNNFHVSNVRAEHSVQLDMARLNSFWSVSSGWLAEPNCHFRQIQKSIRNFIEIEEEPVTRFERF